MCRGKFEELGRLPLKRLETKRGAGDAAENVDFARPATAGGNETKGQEMMDAGRIAHGAEKIREEKK